MKSALQDIALTLVTAAGMHGIIVNNHTQNAREIRLQIETLAHHFDFIDHGEFLTRKHRRSKKPFCLFTFDDGKKINGDETAPEMERLGVPGVFYVVTDYATSGGVQWADRFAALKKDPAFVPEQWGLEHPKELPYHLLEERLKKACGHFNVEADTRDPRVAVMNWDDIRTLHKKGFTIGSHTCKHAILTNEKADAAKADILESIQCVSRELDAPCRTIAFPNGNYNKTLCEYALQCGVDSVMSTDPRWQSRMDAMCALPRIQFHNNYDENRIKLKLLAALPGMILTNPDGTGRRYILKRIRQAMRLPF